MALIKEQSVQIDSSNHCEVHQSEESAMPDGSTAKSRRQRNDRLANNKQNYSKIWPLVALCTTNLLFGIAMA